MSNLRQRGSNGLLRYVSKGNTNTARVRITMAGYSYGVVSTESHTRRHRAFYPHRRALGEFSIRVECNGYKEHRHFQNWLRGYTAALMEGQVGNQRGATLMEVQLPSRRFHKYGILTTGIDDHDNVGSMVFSPTLTFVTLQDFNDEGTSIKSIKSVSSFIPAAGTDTLAFYPVTVSSYKDGDSNLYDAPTGSPVDVLNPSVPITTPVTPGGRGGPNRIN